MRLVVQQGGREGGDRQRPGARLRPPPPQGPWLSGKDWRRAMDIAVRRGLSRAERQELMSRLARVRGGAEAAPSAPRLRVVAGGGAAASGPPAPRTPGAREAA